jgi:hypothetical protein
MSKKKFEPIIETSLMIEAEQLKRILASSDHREIKLARVITWANDLLMAASENEPGQVKLLPFPEVEEDESKAAEVKPPLIRKTPFQRIGTGSGNEIIEPLK